MMKRTLAAGVAAMIGLTGTANAAGSWNNGAGACGGGLFVTCAAVSVSWTGTVLTLNILNQGTEGDLYKAVGIVNLGALPGGWSYVGSGQAGYTSPVSDLNNFPNNRVTAGTNSQGSMIGDGQSGTWIFTFSGLTAAQLDAAMANAYVALHGISGPGGCSTKVGFLADGTTTSTDAVDPACVNDPGDPNTSIPEPATMVLLATGLLGMGGLQYRRKRARA